MTARHPGWLSETTDGVMLRLYIQPKASRSEVSGTYGEGTLMKLKIRVAAPPVDGAANEELVRFLAKILKVALSRVRLRRGESSRSKDVLVEGLNGEQVADLLRSNT